QLRPAHDLPGLAGLVVVARDLPAVPAGVHNICIVRVGRDPAALPPPHRVPVGQVDALFARHAAGEPHGRVVPLGAVDPVGELAVGGHAVELGRRLVVLRGPGPASVEGDRRAAVVAQDHAAGIVRIDPHVVVVSVGHAHAGEGLPAVGRLVHADVGD